MNPPRGMTLGAMPVSADEGVILVHFTSDLLLRTWGRIHETFLSKMFVRSSYAVRKNSAQVHESAKASFVNTVKFVSVFVSLRMVPRYPEVTTIMDVDAICGTLFHLS